MLDNLLRSAAMRLMVVKGRMSLRRLEKSTKNPFEQNEKLLKDIIKRNKNSEFGKAHGFDKIDSIESFRERVPVSVYEDYAPQLERMKNGEENVLTCSKVLGFSRTSGSSGVPKYIPATKPSLKAYVRYTWTRALALGAAQLKKEGKGFVPGRGVFLSPATNEFLPNGLPCSNIAEIGAREYGTFYPFILTVPTRDLFAVGDGDYVYAIYRCALADERVTFIFSVFFSINVSQLEYLRKNWRVIVDDIEKGTVDPSINLKDDVKKRIISSTKPMPERAAYLRSQFEKGFDSTLMKRIWPGLAVICSIGNASFKSATEYVRSLSAGVPFDFSIYGASEGLIAACYELENDSMQLLTDSCFYEFIPYGEPDSSAVTLDKLKQGEKYEILITTQAGLYRYRMKDVIEVKGFRGKCPLIDFVYRKGQLFNLAGEKFSEEDARNTVEMFAKAHGISLDKWLFYHDTSVIPNRYALVAETDFDFDDKCIDELEGYMGHCNKRYPSQREKGFIGRLVVRKQLDGTHDAWGQRCVEQGASRAQIKPVHWLDNDAKREFFMSRIVTEA